MYIYIYSRELEFSALKRNFNNSTVHGQKTLFAEVCAEVSNSAIRTIRGGLQGAAISLGFTFGVQLGHGHKDMHTRSETLGGAEDFFPF